MGMLDELLRLKSFREDKAERAVAVGREALLRTQRQERQADDALTDYRDWSERHERQMYDEVCRRAVQPRELEWLREDVNALRIKEGELEKLHQQAGKHRGEAEAALQSLRQVHEQAVRARGKYEQMIAALADEDRIEAERREDLETEERAAPRQLAFHGDDDDL